MKIAMPFPPKVGDLVRLLSDLPQDAVLELDTGTDWQHSTPIAVLVSEDKAAVRISGNPDDEDDPEEDGE